MLNFIDRYKELLGFVIVYALSFVLMGEAVKQIPPVVSATFTYGLTGLFFFGIHMRQASKLWSSVLEYPILWLVMNVTTLINMVLGFVVVSWVSPLVYVVVFFGSLPFMSMCLKMRDFRVFDRTHALILFLTLLVAVLIIGDVRLAHIWVLGLILLSSFVAAIYMHVSALAHKQMGLNASELLSMRFVLLIFCGALYSWRHVDSIHMGWVDMVLLMGIALTGSIIPLFLMQKSIQKIGALATAQWMPALPILCMGFLWVLDVSTFTQWQILGVIIFCTVLLYQARAVFLSNPKPKHFIFLSTRQLWLLDFNDPLLKNATVSLLLSSAEYREMTAVQKQTFAHVVRVPVVNNDGVLCVYDAQAINQAIKDIHKPLEQLVVIW